MLALVSIQRTSKGSKAHPLYERIEISIGKSIGNLGKKVMPGIDRQCVTKSQRSDGDRRKDLLRQLRRRRSNENWPCTCFNGARTSI